MFVELECFFPMSNVGLLSYIAGSGFSYFFSSISFSSHCPRVLREPRHRRAILGDVGAPQALGAAALSQRWERHLVVDVGGLLAASATLKASPLFLDVLGEQSPMEPDFWHARLSYYLARHHPPLGVICPYLIVITEKFKKCLLKKVALIHSPFPFRVRLLAAVGRRGAAYRRGAGPRGRRRPLVGRARLAARLPVLRVRLLGPCAPRARRARWRSR